MIENYYFLVIGIVLLFIQGYWFYYYKKNKSSLGMMVMSKFTKDILWILSGVVMLVGLVMIIFSFSTILIGIIVAIVLYFAVVPFLLGLFL